MNARNPRTGGSGELLAVKPDLARQSFLFVVAVSFWDLSLALNSVWGPPRVPTGGTLTSLKRSAQSVWFKWNRQAGSYWKRAKRSSLSSACSGCQSVFSPGVSVPKLSLCIICLLCSHIETCHWSFVLATAFLSQACQPMCQLLYVAPAPLWQKLGG